MIKRALITAILFCTGCGITFTSQPESETDTSNSAIKSIELYISKASLSKTEFEQYKVSKGRIFNECGKVYGGRHTTELQHLVRLEEKDRLELDQIANDILEFNKEHELNLDKPGTSTGYYDPGQFTLKIQRKTETTQIKTSFDSVTEASKTSEENLKKLAKKLREIGLNNSNQSLCGNKRFYDL